MLIGLAAASWAGEQHPPTLLCTRTMPGHTGDLLLAATSADGARFATSAGDRSVRVWQASNGEELLVVAADRPKRIALDAAGKRLAIALDREIALWDVESKDEVGRLPRPEPGPMTSLAFSADGKRLIGGTRRRLLVWDIAAGTLAKNVESTAGITSLLALPDGNVLIAEGDGTLRNAGVADLATKRTYAAKPPAKSAGAASHLAVSGDGRLVLSAHVVVLVSWSLTKSEPLVQSSSRQEPPLRAMTAIAVSPDGRLAASTGEDRVIRVWDPAKGTQTRQWREPAEGLTLAFTADGKAVWSLGRDGELITWDPSTGTKLGAVSIMGHRHVVNGLTWADVERNRLASSGGDRSIRIWDMASSRVVKRWQSPEYEIRNLQAAEGELIFSAYDTACFWDGGETAPVAYAAGEQVQHLALANDGSALVTATVSDKGIRVLAGLDPASGEVLWQTILTADQGRCGALVPDPAGGVLAALGKRVVRVDPQTGTMSDFAELPGNVTSLLPVGADLLVVGTSIKGVPAIIALDPTDGRERWRQPSQDQVFAAALAPDGKRLALAVGQVAMGGGNGQAHSYGPPVLVVDPSTGTVVADAGALRETQWGILYSADGTTIISAGSGGAIRYWQEP